MALYGRAALPEGLVLNLRFFESSQWRLRMTRCGIGRRDLHDWLSAEFFFVTSSATGYPTEGYSEFPRRATATFGQGHAR